MKSASFISPETEWHKPQEPLILATGYWLLATGSFFSHPKCNIPRSIAIVTACVRSDAPSLARIF
jgi:hypothetical protein